MAIKFYSLSALLTRSLNSTTNKFPRAEEIEPMNSQLAARSLQLKHLEFTGLNEQRLMQLTDNLSSGRPPMSPLSLPFRPILDISKEVSTQELYMNHLMFPSLVMYFSIHLSRIEELKQHQQHKHDAYKGRIHPLDIVKVQL
uniref:Uncharacterized protein n=1 Tax=Cucumis sativus TaxID=3659 RepID=A0A0A0LGT0_CUCSA